MAYVYNGEIKKIIKGQLSDMTKIMHRFPCCSRAFQYLVTCTSTEVKYKSVSPRNQF